MDITEVVINAENNTADVHALLSVSTKRQGEQALYEGSCSFHFVRPDEYWYIDRFHIPGISQG